MTDKVLVTMVTYNRKELLKVVLEAVKNQSKSVAGILILDNASTDGTEQLLREEGFFNNISNLESETLLSNTNENTDLYYYRNKENLGGAGGFSKAVDLAKNLRYDYLWIMDDDVKPDKLCLENLLKVVNKNRVGAVVPNRNCQNFEDRPVIDFDLSSIRKYFIEKRKKRVKPPFNKDTYSIKTFAFEGPLISMDIIRKVGIPNSEYFLLYDDTDYAQRIQKYTDILFVVSAHMERQIPVSKNVVATKKIPYAWKDYYSIRNNMLFDKKYGKNWGVRHISPLLMMIHLLINSVRKKNTRSNLNIVLRAWKDAMKGKLGKGIGPNY